MDTPAVILVHRNGPLPFLSFFILLLEWFLWSCTRVGSHLEQELIWCGVVASLHVVLFKLEPASRRVLLSLWLLFGNVLQGYILHGDLTRTQFLCTHLATHRHTHVAAFHGLVLCWGSCVVCFFDLMVGPFSLQPQSTLSAASTITTHGASAQQERRVVGRRTGTRADLMAAEGTSFATAFASEGACSAPADLGRNRRRRSRRRQDVRLGHGRRAKTTAKETETAWKDPTRDHCVWRRLGVGSRQEMALTSAATNGRHTRPKVHVAMILPRKCNCELIIRPRKAHANVLLVGRKDGDEHITRITSMFLKRPSDGRRRCF